MKRTSEKDIEGSEEGASLDLPIVNAIKDISVGMGHCMGT